MNQTPLSQLSRKDREQRIDDYWDHRSLEISRLLIKRGRDSERALAVANRFIEMEYKRLVRWD